MGSETDYELNSTPQLPLFSIPPILQSPEHPGMLTPPLHTSASVPFRWEEEPGKPRPCTTLTTITNSSAFKCLELPPRLLTEVLITKMPSPTTVLEGPYMGRPGFQSSSFRFNGEGEGSFRFSGGSPERGQLGAMVLSKRRQKDRGFFGYWGRRKWNLKGKREVDGGSFAFSTAVEKEGGGYGSDGSGGGGGGGGGGGERVKRTKIRRSGSFLGVSHSRSHFWRKSSREWLVCSGLFLIYMLLICLSKKKKKRSS
ncbi:hypothetical protein L1049_013895 [Liquidambar formosana]|uniref:Uncharacterized protein n=1 Tax=Liquidambar formosana TaxID=63359 RepID=A0AAP0WYV0_LIQFO